MLTYDDVLLEMQMRRNSLEAEAKQERWARLAAVGRSQPAREPVIRRVAVQLVDYISGLRCMLQSRFATESGVTAC
jgi:hypothetical protein